MKNSEFIPQVEKSVREQIEIVKASRELLEAKLNDPIPDWHWNVGQIFEHMNMVTKGYREGFSALTIPGGQSDSEVKHSFLAKLLMKANTKPGGAVPGKLVPPVKTYDSSVIDQFISDHEWLIEFARKVQCVPLHTLKIKNPILPILTMTAGDTLGILASHAERHVGQLKDLVISRVDV